MGIKIKICGITDEASLQACIDYGADYAGLVFVKRSRRCLDIEKASTLSQIANNSIGRVGLFADPTDTDLNTVLDKLSLDMIQLHGRESPLRLKEIKALTGLPLIKALPVTKKSDLLSYKSYLKDTEYILYDAKSGGKFGGTGQAFDWSYLTGFAPGMPWGLAGGLSAANVGRALSLSRPDLVDVSGGVELAPGRKDPAKIKEFIETVRYYV